ncbi:ATP synthase regulation protein NCA2-domain-containing protein [Halteromyces radiatus]|uniref:ATP synthase regulation protein NCA2-domain-containing protein n=1 Tax=Halteromyces radiatus TaxID=101107 RepID=UPI002220B923|nr:ATP synthase regulation protein NCA2-domain-containing protein [Halteromyces radiatus]KAI8098649.1 ATP synthase regulation protein NCA2-domain-containing protein [Halteromyces radiatus]
MTTYAIEEVQRLNGSLLELQREHLCSVSHLTTLENTTLTPKQAWQTQNNTDFLLAAIQALDASLSGVPRMDDIRTYLTWYATFNNSTTDDNTLDWLFVTKCTLAVYGHTISSILHSTLPISESLTYWDNIQGNVWYEAYYGIQTAPGRLYSLVMNTRQALLDTSITSDVTTSSIKNVLTSSDHILGSLFPMALRDANKNRIKQRQHSFSRYHGHPGKSLARVFRKLYSAPLPLALIRDEIQQKRIALRTFRTQQASILGLLIKMAPDFGSVLDNRNVSNDGFLVQTDQQSQLVSLHYVARGTTQCVKALSSCLLGNNSDASAAANRMDISPSPSSSSSSVASSVINIQETRDAIEQSIQNFSMISIPPHQVAKDLKQVIDQQPKLYDLQVWKQDYGPPTRWTRYWVPGLVIVFGGKMTLDYLFERKDNIMTWTKEGIQTVREFFVHWLWEPTLGVLDTIRFKDRRIGLSSKEGLKSDLQSLERMVTQFARDHYHLSDDQIIRLASQVRDGDVSVVLRAYENEIKNPLRNAIRGDLIQTLLIQIQKTKVDVDIAMQALDKLLKSNELNFAFLAVAPSMLLTWATFSWIKNMYQKRGGNRVRQIGQPLKDTLRRIERLFTLDTNKTELSCESQGVLLCELLLLRNYAQYLPTRNSVRELFLEDIRDLEAVRLDKQQKKETIIRMHHSWRFLI